MTIDGNKILKISTSGHSKGTYKTSPAKLYLQERKIYKALIDFVSDNKAFTIIKQTSEKDYEFIISKIGTDEFLNVFNKRFKIYGSKR